MIVTDLVTVTMLWCDFLNDSFSLKEDDVVFVFLFLVTLPKKRRFLKFIMLTGSHKHPLPKVLGSPSIFRSLQGHRIYFTVL